MSSFKKKILPVTVCLLLLAAAGCGYTSRSLIRDKFKTIYIAQFANKIDITREGDAANRYKLYRPMLEQDITQAVINKFLWDGNLKPQKEGAAHLTLRGELVEFRRDPLRYTSSQDVEEYRINLVVNIKLWDNKENKLVWEEVRFTGDTTYFTIGPLSKSEDAAVSDALVDLARRIVERTVEQW
ncbi:hypothetical protein D4Q80_00240 [bacterium]|nr:MAG: hypothetical protein D4Q80_00240 [bacterium]